MQDEHGNSEDGHVEGENPTVGDLVAEATDTDLPDGVRAAAYEDALDFFLADENDLEKNPLRDDATVFRYDIEKEQDMPLISVPIRNLDDHEIKALRLQSKEKGPGGIRTEETDDVRFYTLVCAEAAMFPEEKRALLIKKHRTLYNMFQRMLLTGERISLGQHILAFSGFGATVQSKAKDEVESAKN